MRQSASLALFVLIYGIVFSFGSYYVNRLIRNGPQDLDAERPDAGVPLRPISAAHDVGRRAVKERGPALQGGPAE